MDGGNFRRRDVLGSAALLGAAAVASPLAAALPAADGRLADVVARLKAFARAELADKGFPGMSVALLGPGGVQATFAVGLADVDRGDAATSEQLFQIGSITKSLTAMALFVLADRGKLDLDAKVADLLPDHRLPPEPITLTHLLEHSSGLPNYLGDPAAIDTPAGRLWTGFAPGAKYSYCNLGYALLGAVIERAAGMAWPVALETLVLRPLGMGKAVPVYRAADRDLYASGHVRSREDIPWLPKARLARAAWFDFSHAAGSVAATGADMVHYLRFLAGLARGKGAPLFSDALAARFATPTIDSAPAGARYGNGLHTQQIDGRACFRHTGGVPGFSSAVTLDREAGVGCYASVNVGGAGNYRPTEITEYAVAVLHAAGAGAAWPGPRAPQQGAATVDVARVAGTWLAADGGVLTIGGQAGAMFVRSAALDRPLRQVAPGRLATDHKALAPYMLVLEGEGEGLRLRLGSRLFARGAAPVTPPPSPRLTGLAGAYYSAGSWGTPPKVFALGERLFLGAEELVEADDGSWRFRNPDLISERLWFQHEVGGRPQLLNVSGMRYGRVHDRTL